MTKRLFDLVASSIGLVLLAPVMAVIALAVKQDSEGPALFKQERVGRGGEPFTLLKFRSMAVSPELGVPLVTAATDARITKVGARLRATKLDELPQLLNVVKGDMAIVGPRPEVPEYVDSWDPDDKIVILGVRPGITDPVSIRFRHEAELLAEQPDPVAYYRDVLVPTKVAGWREYAETRTFAGDLAIIGQTVVAVISR